jgi:PAS domain S-box-containing protein
MQSSPAQLAAIVDVAAFHDVSDSAVIATDVLGTIVYWNHYAASIYGWGSHETIGRNILDVTPTRSTADEAARIMERLRGGHEWTGKFIVQHRDGTPIVAQVTDIPVREREQVIGIVGVSRRARASGEYQPIGDG